MREAVFPSKSLGLLAFIVYAASVLVLALACFTSPAYAVARDERPYRGYVDIVIENEGRTYAGSVRTRHLIDGSENCQRVLRAALMAYSASVLRTMPKAQMRVRPVCAYDGHYA